MFAQMRMSDTVRWVSAGGDHSTDFSGEYAGITLSYGRKTGVASYGPKFTEPGVRMFDLHYDEGTGKVDFSSYIRQRDGTVDDQEEESRPG